MLTYRMQRFWNTSDRLFLTLVLAAIAHAIVILGITFDLPVPGNIRRSLEITLDTIGSETLPEKTEFFAPENQIGGGGNPEKVSPNRELVPESGQGEEEMPIPSPATHTEARPKPVLQQAQSEKKVVSDDGAEDELVAEHPHLTADMLNRQIAEISAEMNRSHADRAHGPKIVDITQVSANKYKAAAYERNWQDKIERVGTLNFPDEARRKSLSGSLVLSVGLKADGTIYSVKVNKSSGHQVLDDAAMRIVRLAAPFAPFPLELREESDVLVVTRTWTFFSDNRVETTP